MSLTFYFIFCCARHFPAGRETDYKWIIMLAARAQKQRCMNVRHHNCINFPFHVFPHRHRKTCKYCHFVGRRIVRENEFDSIKRILFSKELFQRCDDVARNFLSYISLMTAENWILLAHKLWVTTCRYESFLYNANKIRTGKCLLSRFEFYPLKKERNPSHINVRAKNEEELMQFS